MEIVNNFYILICKVHHPSEKTPGHLGPTFDPIRLDKPYSARGWDRHPLEWVRSVHRLGPAARRDSQRPTLRQHQSHSGYYSNQWPPRQSPGLINFYRYIDFATAVSGDRIRRSWYTYLQQALYCTHYPLSQSWQPGYTSLAEADPAFDTQVERVIKRARDGTCLVRWKVTYSFFVVLGRGA